MVTRKSLLFFLALLSLNYLVASESDAPVISEVTITPSEVDVSVSDVTVTISTRVQDESGIANNPGGYLVNKSNASSLIAGSSFVLVSGDNKDGIWESTVTVPSTTASSEWGIFTDLFRDTWGNSVRATGGNLSVTNRYSESDAPVIVETNISPSSVNVTNKDQIVTLSVYIQDESGIANNPGGYLVNKSNASSLIAGSSFVLVSGDNKDGIWESTVTVPSTTASSEWGIFTDLFRDTWGNSVRATGGNLSVVNNHPPRIRSSSFNVNENSTRIGKLKVNDKDDDNLTYAVSGASSITINSTTGLLTFKKRPNYEQKSQYTFKAYVNDGQVTVSKKITINILDVNEPPSINESNFIINQGQTRKVQLTASDPEGDNIQFKNINGDDASYFTVSKTGVLKFREIPNFDKRTVFNISVEIDDGELTASENLKLTLRTQYFVQKGQTLIDPVSAAGGWFGYVLAASRNGNKMFVQGSAPDYAGVIREYNYIDGNWVNTSNIGDNNGYTYRNLGYSHFFINNAANKVFYLECLTKDNYACNLPDQSNGVELNFSEYNSISGRWQKNGSPLKMKTKDNFIGVDGRGRYIALREDVVLSSSIHNNPECVNIKVKRYKQKSNKDWKKFKKAFVQNNIDVSTNSDPVINFSEGGERLLFYNEYKCGSDGATENPQLRDNSIKVFEYDDNAWVKLGNTIKLDQIFGDARLLSGTYKPIIKINPDLTKIAIAFSTYSMSNDNLSHIYFFNFDASRNKWIRDQQHIKSSFSYGTDTTVHKGYDLFDISDDFKTVIVKDKGFQYGENEVHPPMIIYKYKEGRWKKFGYKIIDDYIHDSDDWGAKVFGKDAQNTLTGDGKNFILHNLYPETEWGKYGFVKMFEIKGN